MNPETTTPETPTRAPLPRWLAPAGTAAIALCAGLVIGAVTASPNSACVEALDTADQAIGVMSDAMFDVSQGLDAAASFDWRRIDDMTARLTVHSTSLEAISPVYLEASAECRGA